MWNCPKCNEASEDNLDSCWKCGAGRGGEAAPPGLISETPAPASAPSKANWPLFFATLFAPMIAAFIWVAEVGAGTQAGLKGMIVIALFGCTTSGLICAMLNARQQAKVGKVKILMIVLSAPLYAALSLVLCFAGCGLASGK